MKLISIGPAYPVNFGGTVLYNVELSEEVIWIEKWLVAQINGYKNWGTKYIMHYKLTSSQGESKSQFKEVS